ncbi:MAG TPA: hypothetical protein VG757_09530 [Devosia sp.]|nr:hypothetical protein [Devosia sp.]
MEILIGFAILMGVPVYLGLQLWSAITIRTGVWRLLVLAPLIVAIPIAAWCLYALTQDSNLWPLLFILFAPFGAIYLAVILVLRAMLPRT